MDSQYEAGMATRKQMMGEAFVEAAIANTTPFTQPIQDHINRAAWGDTWQRPGLDLKTRSLNFSISSLHFFICCLEKPNFFLLNFLSYGNFFF